MQNRVAAAEARPALPGMRWAVVMLALQATEVLALTEVIFFDRKRDGIEPQFGWVEIYFGALLTTVITQLAGILCVRGGKYRIGGGLQIAASVMHLVKIEGLIGMVGGFRAWNHGKDGTAAPSPRPEPSSDDDHPLEPRLSEGQAIANQ